APPAVTLSTTAPAPDPIPPSPPPRSPSHPCRRLLLLLRLVRVTAPPRRRSTVRRRRCSGPGRTVLGGPIRRRRVLGPVRASIHLHLALLSSSVPPFVFPFFHSMASAVVRS
uniref:Uncharacterized protein n=1 Tax=Oryza brachyantha TaxID=4533 RepID=J3M7J5_ORYBR